MSVGRAFGRSICLLVVCAVPLVSGCRSHRQVVMEEVVSAGVQPVQISGDTAVVRYRLSAPVTLSPLMASGKGVKLRATVEDRVLTVSARSEPKEVQVPYVVVRQVHATPERESGRGYGGYWWGGGVLGVLLLHLWVSRRRK